MCPLTTWIPKNRSLERILYIRAVRNPGTSYVQGMNDLVTPFISGALRSAHNLCCIIWWHFAAVFLSELFNGDASFCNLEGLSACKLFDVEADCYWCLCKVLDSIQDHYTFAQPGIQKICFRVGEVSCCGLGDSAKKSVIYSVGNLFSTGGQAHWRRSR